MEHIWLLMKMVRNAFFSYTIINKTRRGKDAQSEKSYFDSF